MGLFDDLYKSKTSTTKPSISRSVPRRDENNHGDSGGGSSHTSDHPRKKSRKRKRKRASASNVSTSTAATATTTEPPRSRPRAAAGAAVTTPSSLSSALDFSAELKEASSRKDLRSVLRSWRDRPPAHRDAHHGCLVVDCCSRCGDPDRGAAVLAEMPVVPVQAWTALLKGYAHAGRMREAEALWRERSDSSERETTDRRRSRGRSRPNVRTLNTFLRGCLWTADDGDGAGGAGAATRVWAGATTPTSERDASSYEYAAALSCRALRPTEANERLDEYLRNAGDDASAETAAASEVRAAVARALLGNRIGSVEAARRALTWLKREETAVAAHHDDGKGSSSNTTTTTTGGGRRAWKRDDSGGGSGRRNVSNELFRGHRRSELTREANTLASGDANVNYPATTADLASCLLRRMIYFGGGGTTEAESKGHQDDVNNDVEEVSRRSLRALWHDFGLRTLVRGEETVSSNDHEGPSRKDLNKLRHLLNDHDDSVPPLPVHLTPLLPSTGRLDVERVFSRSSSTIYDRELRVELGAGAGDWVVSRARAEPDVDWLAVELRADRVARTLSRAVLGGVRNVACVGADAETVLRRRLVPGSVARVHANHPEPPTQVVEEHDAEEKDEPAHMLRASTMEAVVDCLRPDGRGELIVVTDNWWYAKLILNTAAEVVRRRAAAASGGNITNLEQTPLDADPDLDPALSAFTHGGQRLVLYEGTPGPSVGHGGGSGEGGTSYFDRLWRTGAGRQSRTKQRFVVALRTTSKTTTTTTATTAAKQRTSARAQARGGGGGKKKRSAAKQAERNNRRLEAKRKKKQSWDEDDKSQR